MYAFLLLRIACTDLVSMQSGIMAAHLIWREYGYGEKAP